MRVLVTGSRKWSDRDMVFEVLDHWLATCGISEIVEGCANGADALAEAWAHARHVPLWHFPADWERYGKRAGAMRNSRMLIDGEPEMVIAFHDDLANSAGTGDMVHKARKSNLEVVVVSHPAPERPVGEYSTMPESGR